MCVRIVYNTINANDCSVYVCGYDTYNDRMLLLYKVYTPSVDDCYMLDKRNTEHSFLRACELFVEDNQAKKIKDNTEYTNYPLVKMCELNDTDNGNYAYWEFHSSYRFAPCKFYDKVS